MKKALEKDKADDFTPYQHMKTQPKKATITNFRALIAHHDWLMSFDDVSPYLKDIAKVKLEQFAGEARSLDAPHIKAMSNLHKKYSLIACLLAQSQAQTKDALAITFSRCITASDKAAERYYESLDDDKEVIAENLAEFLSTLTHHYQEKREQTEELVAEMEQHYKRHGGPEKILNDCDKIIGKKGKKHLPWVWHYYKNKRPAIFKCLNALTLGGNTQAEPLLKALEIIKNNSTRKTEWLKTDKPIDLSFASHDCQSLIKTKDNNLINRHHLEVSVMDELAESFHSGDVYIEGADAYGNYRRDLLPWEECEQQLDDFCDTVNLANNKHDMVDELKKRLTNLSMRVDKNYPHIKELVIDENDRPVLKKRKKSKVPKTSPLLSEIKKRMPERRLLDILCLTNACTEWAHLFSPLSGKNAKLPDPLSANIVTTFGFGTRMGPYETARHVRSSINAKTITLVNKSHINLTKLAKALARIVNYYKGFPLIKEWGTGEKSIVDGTLCGLYEQNLLVETHIRYGAKGGIAYHHISDTYIALFSSLIPCGVWEAIGIIDGLLKNQSKIKPKQVHGDTQAQSATVFGLGYLFGIRIMPRIRNWKELVFFRPTKTTKYKYIDSLFKGTVNWQLIEDNWQDMMQLVLSIQSGKVSSTLVLKRLGSRSRKNQLYRAFRELGRVIRTIFLLDYISDVELRESITAEINKVESFHNLSEWISFASRAIVASNNTKEMEKAIRYNTLIVNLVILQNVIDMSQIIQQLRTEGWVIKKEDLAVLSPYLTEHIKRFGDYVLDLMISNIGLDKIRQAAVIG